MLKEHLSEPWFTLVNLGLKTFEGRLNKGRFKELEVGDVIEWYNSDFCDRSVWTRVISKNAYKTYEDYLTEKGIKNCLPGIVDMREGLSVYYKYYTKEQEQEFGVVAIELKKINLKKGIEYVKANPEIYSKLINYKYKKEELENKCINLTEFRLFPFHSEKNVDFLYDFALNVDITNWNSFGYYLYEVIEYVQQNKLNF